MVATVTSPPVGAIPGPDGAVYQYTPFNGPDTLWKWNALCQAMSLGVPGVMFLARVYVRAWIKRIWTLEDWLSVLSYISLCTYSALITTLIYKHGGTHEWDVLPEDAIIVAYYVNVGQIWYGVTATFIKVDILLLMLRVFCPSQSRLAIFIRGFIVVICLFYFSLGMSKILQCVPREKIWNPKVDGQCVNLSILLDASGMFNILSDVVLLLIPLKGLWSLKLEKRRKVGIYVIFTVGIIGPVFSIIGLVMRFRLAESKDQTYNQPEILLWATAELATGMMVISLPIVPGLFQRRHSRPSLSIVNNSRRSKSAYASRYYPRYGLGSTDDSNVLEQGAYHELDEVVRTTISTSEDKPFASVFHRGRYVGGERGQLGTSDGMILKTITVEQISG